MTADNALKLYYLRNMQTDLFSNGEIVAHSWQPRGKGWLSLGSLTSFLRMLVKQTGVEFLTLEVVECRLHFDNDLIVNELEEQSRIPAAALID